MLGLLRPLRVSASCGVLAGPADAVSALVAVEVLAVVWVPLRALRLGRPKLAGFPSLHVLGVRNGLEVRRVVAVADAAQMVDLQARWDRTFRRFIGGAVDLDLLAFPARAA